MAQLWIQYCDLVWVILYCLRETKTNDLDLHIISMDHQNYAWYLKAYILLLLNLTHPTLELMHGQSEIFNRKTLKIG